MKTLEPLYMMFSKVELVLNDGATYFPKIVKELFPNAEHQLCLVHIERNHDKEMD